MSTTSASQLSPPPPLNVRCTDIRKEGLIVEWKLPKDISTTDKFVVEALDKTIGNQQWVMVAETQTGTECFIKVNLANAPLSA